jgi:UDP-glucose 4-epimerase
LSIYSGKKVLITGGLGFIGSNLARELAVQGANVTLVDSLIPTYGGNPYNIHDIRDRLTVNVCDVRDPFAMAYLLQGKDYLFNLAGQTSPMDSMSDPQTDLEINAAAQLSILEACRTANLGIKLYSRVRASCMAGPIICRRRKASDSSGGCERHQQACR